MKHVISTKSIELKVKDDIISAKAHELYEKEGRIKLLENELSEKEKDATDRDLEYIMKFEQLVTDTPELGEEDEELLLMNL